jgi:hypothetical protein
MALWSFPKSKYKNPNMYTKEYVNEQALKCMEKLEEIMGQSDKVDDPELSALLINFDFEFSVFYNRWISFYANFGPPVSPDAVTSNDAQSSETTVSERA